LRADWMDGWMGVFAGSLGGELVDGGRGMAGREGEGGRIHPKRVRE